MGRVQHVLEKVKVSYTVNPQNETKQSTSFTLKFCLQFYLSQFLTFKEELVNWQDLACRSIWFGLCRIYIYFKRWFSAWTNQSWISFYSRSNVLSLLGQHAPWPQLAGAE